MQSTPGTDFLGFLRAGVCAASSTACRLRKARKRLAAACGVGLLGLFAAGCAELPPAPSWVPFAQETPDELPGVVAPAQQIEQLRALAEAAGESDPAEREKVSAELARSIREADDPMIRTEIVRTLAKYPSATTDAVLRAALEDPDTDVRIAACEAWGTRGDASAVAVLAEVLTEDAEADVRLMAARALGQSKDPAAVAALGKVLGDKDPAMQYRAVLSLREITGKDFNHDVGRWQQYVRGETPEPKQPVSIAERLEQLF